MSRLLIDLQACQTEGSRNRGIGRYSQSLALALAKLGAGSHELYFAINAAYEEAALDLRQRFAGSTRWDRLIEYRYPEITTPWLTERMDAKRTLAALAVENSWMATQPDIIHINSIFEGLAGRAVVPALDTIPRSTLVSATAYDLIPLLFRERYLATPATRDWYINGLNTLRRCDLVLAISDATRRDLIEHLDMPEHKVVNISGAADEAFSPAPVSPDRRQDLARRLGLHRPFVMYTGGIDHRKNVEALIGAYARIPVQIRSLHQLAIVCNASGDQIRTLLEVARARGLGADEAVLTGFVEEEDLADLYRTCKMFVFPSLYEGFGLPLLEAMASGAPCIAGDNSSLLEIIGDRSFCFDARSEEAIAAAISRMLTDDNWRNHAVEHSRSRASLFSWDRTGQCAMNAIEAALARRRENAEPSKRKPRLAYVSPLPPERSGIANFSEELLPHLREHFELDLYVTESVDPLPWIKQGYGAYPWQRLAGKYEHYDGRVFYQVGNSHFHVHMAAMLAQYPGVVLVHDAFLSGLAHQIALFGAGSPLPGFFPEQVEHSEGAHGTNLLQTQGVEAAIRDLPVNRWIVELASGIICTSDQARALLDPEENPSPVPIMVVRSPFGLQPRSPEIRRKAREALGLDQDHLVACSFGYVAEPKAILECIEAWSQSEAFRRGAQLVLVGEAPGEYGNRVRALIDKQGLGESILITGYVDDATFERYLDACDFAVQLRSRTLGEVSAAVLRNFARGTPVIVNDVGSMAELAPDGAVHLPPAFTPTQLAAALDSLVADTDLRQRVGERGRTWLGSHCDPKAAALSMANFIGRSADCNRRARLTRLAGSIASVLVAVPSQAHAEYLDFDHRTVADFNEQRLLTRPHFASFVSDMLLHGSVPIPARDEGAAIRLDASSPLVMTDVGRKTEGKSLVSAGRAGILMYGPYLPLAAGHYVVRLFGKWLPDSPPGGAAMDVIAEGGARVLGVGEVPPAPPTAGTSSLLEMAVKLESRAPALEIRVHVTAETSIAIDGFEIAPVY